MKFLLIVDRALTNFIGEAWSKGEGEQLLVEYGNGGIPFGVYPELTCGGSFLDLSAGFWLDRRRYSLMIVYVCLREAAGIRLCTRRRIFVVVDAVFGLGLVSETTVK